MTMIPIKQAEQWQVGKLPLANVPQGCVFQWGEDRTKLFIKTSKGAVSLEDGMYCVPMQFLGNFATIRKVKHLELED